MKKYKWKFEVESGGGIALGLGYAKGHFKGEMDFALLLGPIMITLSRGVVADAERKKSLCGRLD